MLTLMLLLLVLYLVVTVALAAAIAVSPIIIMYDVLVGVGLLTAFIVKKFRKRRG